MKNILKIKTAIILALAITLFSCGSDDDEPTPQIDLSAESFNLSLIKTSDFIGVVTIKGIVKNIGDDFSSSEGQQVAILYQRNLGVTNNLGTEVARKSFISLRANETLEVSYSRAWNVNLEFPPEYILVINYDSDIYVDDNLHNDDTNHDNDELIV